MEKVTLSGIKFVYCLLFLISIHVTSTSQELSSPETALNSQHMPNLVPQRRAPPSVKAAADGNATLDTVNEGLARLESNLASLIQSFLTLQRSVFNLEQLQELLVLLLEDILKQTGNMGVPKTDGTDPSNRIRNSGDNSHGYDDLGDSDSDSMASAELTEDGDMDAGRRGRGTNGNEYNPNGSANERGVGGDKVKDPLQTTRMVGRRESMSGPNKDSNFVTEGQNTAPLPRRRGSSDANFGGSSEGGRSYSDEDYSGTRTAMALDHRRQLPRKGMSGPRTPLWAERLTSRATSDIQSHFQDVVRHIAARQRPPTTMNNLHSQSIGLMQETPRSPAGNAESTLDRLPIFEPLEIVPVPDSLSAKENKLRPEILPFNVKLKLESPVISHGSPLHGPEQHSSPFLEHLGGLYGAESAGERPTGMINNLMHQTDNTDPVFTKDGNKVPPASETSPAAPPGDQIPTPDIRRRRQTEVSTNNKTPLAEMVSEGEANTPIVVTDSKLDESRYDKKRFSTKSGLTSSIIHGALTTLENSVDPTVYVAMNLKNTIPSPITDTLVLEKQSMKNDLSRNSANHEYDFQIAALLKDLNTKLQQHHLKQQENDSADTNSIISRVVSEISKLTWIPSDDKGNFHAKFDTETKSPVINESLSASVNNGSMRLSILTVPGKSVADSTRMPPTKVSKTTESEASLAMMAAENSTVRFTSPATVLPSDKPMPHMSENYQIPGQSDAIDTEVVIITDLKTTQSLPTEDTKERTPTTTVSSSPPNATIVLSSTTSSLIDRAETSPKPNSSQWDWLRSFTKSTESQPVDWAWLIDTMTQLSQEGGDLADLLNALSDRGRALAQAKQDTQKDETDESGTKTAREDDVDKSAPEDDNDSNNAISMNKDNDDNEEEITFRANVYPETPNKEGTNVKNTIFTDLNEPVGSNNIVTNVAVDNTNNDPYDENVDDDHEGISNSLYDDDSDVQSYNLESYEAENKYNSSEGELTVSSSDITDDENTEENSDVTLESQEDDSEYNVTDTITDDPDLPELQGHDVEQVQNTARNNMFDNDDDTFDVQTDDKNHNYDRDDDTDPNDDINDEENDYDDDGDVNGPHTDENIDNDGIEENQKDDSVKDEERDKLTYTGSLPVAEILSERIPRQQKSQTYYTPSKMTLQRYLYSILHHRLLSLGDRPIRTKQNRAGQQRSALVGYQRKRREVQNSARRQKRQAGMTWQQLFNPHPPTNQYPVHQRAGTNAQRHPSSQTITNSPRAGLSSPSGAQTLPNTGTTFFNPRPTSLGLGPQNSRTNLANTGGQYGQRSSINNNANLLHSNPANFNNRRHQSFHHRLFNPPSAGYHNYLGFLGFNYPNFGFSNPEPGEKPSMELGSPMDVEEILNTLFQRYWQRVYNLYTRPTVPTTTTVDMDLEPENPTTTTTTTSTPTTIISTSIADTVAASAVTLTVNATSSGVTDGSSPSQQPPGNDTSGSAMSNLNSAVTASQAAKPTTKTLTNSFLSNPYG